MRSSLVTNIRDVTGTGAWAPGEEGTAFVMGHQRRQWDQSYDLRLHLRRGQREIDDFEVYREACLAQADAALAPQPQASDPRTLTQATSSHCQASPHGGTAPVRDVMFVHSDEEEDEDEGEPEEDDEPEYDSAGDDAEEEEEDWESDELASDAEDAVLSGGEEEGWPSEEDEP
jgi:hypothetical protein